MKYEEIKQHINYGDIPKLADFIYILNVSNVNANVLSRDGIIFCYTDLLFDLFSYLKFSSRKYILITHWSDHTIDESIFKLKPNCIKKWYGYSVSYKNPALIHMHVGIAPLWIDKNKKINEAYNDWFAENRYTLYNVEKKLNEVYCNYDINTSLYRCDVRPILENNNVLYKWIDTKNSFIDYCTEMSQYKFVLSPPGNGIDTHRNLEALYLGCIPIVFKHFMYDQYDLPFLQIKKYSDITPELLQNYLNYYNNHTFNYESLDFIYWQERIANEMKQIKNSYI